MLRRVLGSCLMLLLLTASACGGDDATSTNAEPSPASRPAAGYVREVTATFETLIEARARWEGASGRPAVRRATQRVLEREREMLEQLKRTEPPAEVRDQHERMVATLERLVPRLERVMAADRFDTDAADTEVGRMFDVETIVGELYRFG